MSQPQTAPTKMAQDPVRSKMVKVKILRDTTLPGKTEILRPGTEVEVAEEVANELCDKGFECAPQFRGERDSQDPTAQKHVIYKAVRL